MEKCSIIATYSSRKMTPDFVAESLRSHIPVSGRALPQKIVPCPRKFTEDPLCDVQEPSERSRHTCGTSLGASLACQKKYADAEPQLVFGYEGMKRRQDAMTAPDRPALDEAGQSILKLYRDWGKPEKAAEWKQNVQSTSNRDK